MTDSLGAEEARGRQDGSKDFFGRIAVLVAGAVGAGGIALMWVTIKHRKLEPGAQHSRVIHR